MRWTLHCELAIDTRSSSEINATECGFLWVVNQLFNWQLSIRQRVLINVTAGT
jgi:hypothetical protein